jgi:hypothetical protein
MTRSVFRRHFLLGSASRVVLSGNHVFVADGAGGLRIVDVSNPNMPTEVGFVSTGGSTYDVDVSGGHAFVADGAAGMRVIDVSNPGAPVEVGAYTTICFAAVTFAPLSRAHCLRARIATSGMPRTTRFGRPAPACTFTGSSLASAS